MSLAMLSTAFLLTQPILVLAGTSVYWDFVELPSQIMENWCYEKETLELFAFHYQTGEIIPMEYITKIKESAAFMQGLQTLRQLGFGLT